MRAAWLLVLSGCYDPVASGSDAAPPPPEDAPPRRFCGDRHVQPPEECDDGNQEDGDECSARCLACDVQYEGHCYTRSEQTGTYLDLQDTCSRGAGHPVTYASMAEEATVLGGLAVGSLAWIGLDDLASLGEFQWVTREVLGYEHFSGTTFGAPCVAHEGDGAGAWATLDCGTLALGFCEREGWSIGPDAHAYLLLHDLKTWAAAVQRCQDLSAHLVTITSFGEDLFVRALYAGRGGPSGWIGLSDEQSEGTWTWLTPEGLDYQDWAAEEPLGGSIENCALMTSGGWRDDACGLTFRYVCEID